LSNDGRLLLPLYILYQSSFSNIFQSNNEELNDLYTSPNTFRVIKSRIMRWVGHVARMGEKRGIYRVLVGKPEGKRPLGRPRRRWEDNINPLTSNDTYSGRTAPLTSKRCIFYIYSTNIGTEYFKHVIHSSFFSLQNAVCFIILTYFVPALFTFCIQDVLKLKK